MNLKSMLAKICVIACALATAGGAIALGATTHGHHRHHTHNARVVQEVVPASSFAALNGPPDAVDADAGPDSLPGASDAHRLNATGGLARAWITTNGPLVCLDVVGNGGAATVCDAASDAIVNGTAMTIGGHDPSDPVLAVGVVPDGVDQVTITGRDGRRHVLPVTGNAYAAMVAGGTESVALSRAGHVTTRPLPSYKG